jgi:hypothetical protein
MARIGTIASGVGVSTTLPIQYNIPQALYFEIATTPQSIKINVNGETVVMDLDTNGLNAMKNIASNGTPVNGFFLMLATGFIADKNLEITIVNNVASAFDVYSVNDRWSPVVNGKKYMCQTLGVSLNASQNFDLRNFYYAGFPSIVPADVFNWRTTDGLSARQEDVTMRGYLQYFENNTAGKFAVDNRDGRFEFVNLQPNAAQKIYYSRLIPTV